MKIASLIRANDWWEPKIVPLLVVGYMTVNHYNENILAHFVWLLFLILAIALGAVFVSILNDYTDLTYDLASQKSNRLAPFSPFKRTLILLISFITSISISYIFVDSILTLCFCLSTYLAFMLYSIPPFRLKNKGLLGVMADAGGAHLFVSLFIVASMTDKMGQAFDLFWLSMIGFWSFLYGLRGILWHQFLDRENDLSINHPTFAGKIQISSMKHAEKVIALMELGMLVIILITVGEILPLVALAVYFILLIGYKKLNQEVILILTNDKNSPIFLSDYYQILLPFSLIISCSIENPICLILIPFHVLFFPFKLKILLKNILLMMRIKRFI
ncbi:hypothetical protein V7S76_11795 [Aquirufa sp. ROCK2-A2]